MRSISKKLFLKKRKYHNKILKKYKVFKYRGFIIQIWINNQYSFKYEYSIVGNTNQAKTLLHTLKVKIIYDVTSHKFLYMCKLSAKETVNEILSPLYLKTRVCY